MKKTFCFLLLSIIIIFIPALCSASGIISAASADKADLLSDAEERYIDTKNRELNDKCGAQIIIATVKSTGELTLSEYANELFKSFRLDSAGRSNSVLVVMCTDKRDYTVLVSEGISGSFTIQRAQECLAEFAEEDFAKKNYALSAIKTYNGIASWYNENYSDVSVELTEDMTEYKNMIKSERRQAKRRKAGRTAVTVAAAVSVLIIILYFRRKIRLLKLRRKRMERREEYMHKTRQYR